MRTLLIIGTAVEIVVVVGALAVYLGLISGVLRRINRHLGKVAFGVRAIESQTAPLGASVTRVNGQLVELAAAFDGLAESAAGNGAGEERG